MNTADRVRMLQRIRNRIETNFVRHTWFKTRGISAHPIRRATPKSRTKAINVIPPAIQKELQTCNTCLEGAVYAEAALADRPLRDVHELMGVIEKQITARTPTGKRIADLSPEDGYAGLIPHFNDQSNKSAVLKVIDKAIESEKQKLKKKEDS